MRTEIIYGNRSLYRDDFKVQGYIFGTGKKAVCIIGNMRGNEYQQLYVCSQLVKKLKELENEDLLVPGWEIHINMRRTGFEDVEMAKKFGMPYVVLRNPRPYDTTTLNYNWQIWNTKAFSLYTTSTNRINPASARRGVASVLTFLASCGYIRYRRHEGYLSQVVDDREMISVRAPEAGLFEASVGVEQEVREGMVLARILNPVDGEEPAKIYAPADGIVFILHREPLTYEHTAVIKLIRL